MGILNPSPESGLFNTVEHWLARRPEVIEISTNAVENVYIKLYKAGAFLTEAETKKINAETAKPYITNRPEEKPDNVVDLKEYAEEKQQMLLERSRQEVGYAHRINKQQRPAA